jgi:hypothetical protein
MKIGANLSVGEIVLYILSLLSNRKKSKSRNQTISLVNLEFIKLFNIRIHK